MDPRAKKAFLFSWKGAALHAKGKQILQACLPFTSSAFETNVTILVTEQKWKLSVLI